MRESLAERGVAVRREVSRAVVRLVSRAVRRPAEDALAVRRRQLRVDVDRCEARPHRTFNPSALLRQPPKENNGTLTSIDVGQVPGRALAAELAKVAEAVLGEDHVGGDARVVANEATVASTRLAVRAVRVAAGAAPCADALEKH